MAIKTWIVGKMNRVVTRADLPPRYATRVRSDARGSGREPTLHPAAGHEGIRVPSFEHLGQYAPLVGAMRKELEDFVASHLRRHLAIAERDRYLLTSIHVDSAGTDEAHRLLERFCREFTPEQIKQYLAKEVIARLPNASAIDLSQFAGLNADREPAPEEPLDDGLDELMNELRGAEPAANKKAYDVTLVGRWMAGDGRALAGPSRLADSPPTPLAGGELALEVEDAKGARRVTLTAVPGRHYIIGKDLTCDIPIDGVYASRRHCELWMEHGAWWATDSGSTNGIRIEAADATHGRGMRVSTPSDRAVLEVPPGACIVLTASARGDARQYPRLVLRAPGTATVRSAEAIAERKTPVTPIAAPRAAGRLTLAVRMASGSRTIELPEGAAPFRVGRSRSQTLVIDWAHESVSGHHVDIVEPDATGAHVVVHGDNGVRIEGTQHGAGARFRWRVGETMLLGRGNEREPECSLMLTATPAAASSARVHSR
jgi:hypothetical protein